MDGTSSISLRRRARWSLHHTRWLSLTHDILPAVAAAVATYFITLVTAPAGTPIDRRAVGYPLGAGVVALAAVFVLVNLVEFTIKCAKAGPQLRIEADQGGQDSLIATAHDTLIKDWLRQQLGRPEFHVHVAAVFGSVTQAYPTRDVDVVVQLKPASDHHVRKQGLRLKGLSRSFEKEFGLPMHLQLFTSAEADKLLSFATRAGSLDVLIGEGHWVEISALNTSTSSEAE